MPRLLAFLLLLTPLQAMSQAPPVAEPDAISKRLIDATSAPLAAEKGRIPENPQDMWSFQKVDGQTAEEDRKDAQIRKEMYLYASVRTAGIEEACGPLERYEAIDNPTQEQKRELASLRRLKRDLGAKLQEDLQKWADELDFLQRFRAKRAKGVEPITDEEMNTLRKIPKNHLTQSELKLLGRSQSRSVPSADAPKPEPKLEPKPEAARPKNGKYRFVFGDGTGNGFLLELADETVWIHGDIQPTEPNGISVWPKPRTVPCRFVDRKVQEWCMARLASGLRANRTWGFICAWDE